MKKIILLDKYDLDNVENIRYHTGRIEKQIFLCGLKDEDFFVNYCKESQASNIIVEILNI